MESSKLSPLGKAINSKPSKDPADLPLRIPIGDVCNNVYEIDVNEINEAQKKELPLGDTVIWGRIETGTVSVGDHVIARPSSNGKGAKGMVTGIMGINKLIKNPVPGDVIIFSVRGIKKEEISRGDLVGNIKSPPKLVSEVTARVIVVQDSFELKEGYTAVFHFHTCSLPCKITKIISKIDPETYKILEMNPESVKKGELAIVKIKPSKNISIEIAGEFPHVLCCFAIRDSGRTTAAGLCIDAKEQR